MHNKAALDIESLFQYLVRFCKIYLSTIVISSNSVWTIFLLFKPHKNTQMEELHNMEYIYDKSQSEAIRHFKGACLCIAGPGSG